MNLDSLNKWLTLISNLGVLAGIVLILVQLDQNEKLMQAQMSQERANVNLEFARDTANSDYLPQINAKRRTASSEREWISELTPEEFQRIFALYIGQINSVRNQFYLYKQGFLAEEVWRDSTIPQAARLIQRAYAIGDPELFEGVEGFRDMLKEIASDRNLPFPNEDGSWD